MYDLIPGFDTSSARCGFFFALYTICYKFRVAMRVCDKKTDETINLQETY